MKRTILGLAMALTVLAASPAVGADDTWTEQAKEKLAYFKKYKKKAKDYSTYGDMVMDLASSEHPLCAEYLGREINREKDVDRQMICAAALAEFKRDDEGKKAAGKALHDALDKGKKLEDDVKDSIVDSIGRLQYKPAVFSLCEILRKGGNPWLLVTTVRAVGRLEDMRALPTLLELWERAPVGYSWETGEVTVDTGASGTTDQEAAEAAWHAKYGNQMKGKGKPPVMFKAYIQELAKAVKRITGEEMAGAQELREWMEANAKMLHKLGVEIPRYKGGTRKKKDDDGKKKN